MTRKRSRAIIINQNSILLIKRVIEEHVYWVFPGGGVEQGESAKQALERECIEELGINVLIGNLFTQEVSEKTETFGHEEYFYFAEITGGVIGEGNGPEHRTFQPLKGNYEIVWEDISNIAHIDLRPTVVRDKLLEYLNKKI